MELRCLRQHGFSQILKIHYLKFLSNYFTLSITKFIEDSNVISYTKKYVKTRVAEGISILLRVHPCANLYYDENEILPAVWQTT